jgi:eukaryotic-like serine/threonine-protein kinase
MAGAQRVKAGGRAGQREGLNHPGTVISGATRSYEIVEELKGRTGVRLARQHGELGFSKLVAVKSVRSDHAEIIHALVVDEARLRHANIVSTLDVLVEGAVVHVVMEHIEGPCLADLVNSSVSSGRRLSQDVVATIMQDVLLGLDHAHGAHDETMGLASMLHCDVSPQNVIVGFDGLARIVDLGIPRARSADDPPTKDKLAYLAPEQLEGRPIDRTADIYACGVFLWELLTGARLFDGVSSSAVTVVPKPSSLVRGLSPKLDDVVARATSRDSRDRYQTAGVMARALADAIKPTTRVKVGEGIRNLATATPHLGVRAVGLSDASLLERAKVRASALRVRASALVAQSRLRGVRPWCVALLKRLTAPMRHISFATRVLVAFSVVSVLVLALLGGRTRRSAPVRVVTTAPVIVTDEAPKLASPSEEPAIEIDDELPPTISASPPAAPSAAKPRGARRVAEAKVAAKSATASPAWLLLH